jgi:4-hydroxybenzoate decarboxylase
MLSRVTPTPPYMRVTIPDLSIPLDPGSEPVGITHKVVIDAPTPVAPEIHGHYDQPLDNPVGTEDWEKKLQEMISGR